MSLENTATSPPVNVISRVSVKPPPFWKINPTLWFAQLEAQFDIAGINSDYTKFNYVISSVESDILNTVSDLVLDPPSEEKYQKIKTRLIELHSESKESKIRRLLQGIELGDQRPSQLLTRMRALAGADVGEALLKSLWLSRLSPNTQSILAALNVDLSGLASVADKISDMTTPSVFASTASANTSDLEQQIAHLTKQVGELSAIVSDRGRQYRTRERTPNRWQRSPSPHWRQKYKEPTNNVCFYHINFGEKARKCTPPCTFKRSEN